MQQTLYSGRASGGILSTSFERNVHLFLGRVLISVDVVFAVIYQVAEIVSVNKFSKGGFGDSSTFKLTKFGVLVLEKI